MLNSTWWLTSCVPPCVFLRQSLYLLACSHWWGSALNGKLLKIISVLWQIQQFNLDRCVWKHCFRSTQGREVLQFESLRGFIFEMHTLKRILGWDIYTHPRILSLMCMPISIEIGWINTWNNYWIIPDTMPSCIRYNQGFPCRIFALVEYWRSCGSLPVSSPHLICILQ